MLPVHPNFSLLNQTRLLLESYRHWTGRDLLDYRGGLQDQAEQLFAAPFVVVSHGAEADPILNYGNQYALQLWEMAWEEFIRTPSRLTAEPVSREARTRLLAEVTAKGYIDHYHGIRISKTGRRFKIDGAVVWNLIGEEGEYRGQAATFKDWKMIAGDV